MHETYPHYPHSLTMPLFIGHAGREGKVRTWW